MIQPLSPEFLSSHLLLYSFASVCSSLARSLPYSEIQCQFQKERECLAATDYFVQIQTARFAIAFRN